MDLKAIAPVLYEVAHVAPIVGKTVRVGQVVGKVFWHGKDRYSHAWRYGDSASLHMRECAGRSGYRIGIVTASGESVFVPAKGAYVCVPVAL